MPLDGGEQVQIWGRAPFTPVVRYGHWLLVLAFGIAYLTTEESKEGAELVHVWAGYIVSLILVLRVLWGVVGPRRARCRDFVFGPLASTRYLVDLLSGRARRYLGHSPAGGAMVVLLLPSLAATVLTGRPWKGPPGAIDAPITPAAYADEHAGSQLRGLTHAERPKMATGQYMISVGRFRPEPRSSYTSRS